MYAHCGNHSQSFASVELFCVYYAMELNFCEFWSRSLQFAVELLIHWLFCCCKDLLLKSPFGVNCSSFQKSDKKWQTIVSLFHQCNNYDG